MASAYPPVSSALMAGDALSTLTTPSSYLHQGGPHDCAPPQPSHHHIIIDHLIDFSHTGDAFALAFFIFSVGIFKLVVAQVKQVPNSVCLLVMGVCCGYVISLIYPREVYLKPSWFFNFLLPVIVFEAGFCMKNKDFFQNIGTISLYAVVGTVVNIAILSALYLYVRSYFKYEYPIETLVLFATIICAVDPVAVLTVFDDIKVNEVLYICVFGESLLNDAVTIVLYQAVNAMQEAPGAAAAAALNSGNLTAALEAAIAEDVTDVAVTSGDIVVQVLALVITFLRVCFGGIVFGLIGGYFTSLCSRLLVAEQMVQPVVLLVIPYMTYLLTDSFHFSGLLAMIICGVISKNYTTHNIHDDIMNFTELLLKFLVSYSESAVFVFLGISLWSDHDYDAGLILFTLFGIFFARFIGVFVLTALVNKVRPSHLHIGIRDQFIMAYGGLRGAVCYGLVMTLDEGTVPTKRALVSATIIVVAFTTIVQGSSIKTLVRWFQVRLSKKLDHDIDNDHKVFNIVNRNVFRTVVDFVENMADQHRDNIVYHRFREFDERYLKPNLIAQYAEHCELIEQHKAIEMNEYAESIRCGSFAGLPHTSSQAKIVTSASENFLSAEAAKKAPQTTFLVVERPTAIPRNESISGFVQDTFESRERPFGRDLPRRSIYSRHLVDVPSPVVFNEADPESSFDERSYNFTYHGGGDRQLARNIRAFAASQRSRRAASPRRRFSAIPAEPRHSVSVGRATAAPGSLKARHEKPTIHFEVEDETQPAEPIGANRAPPRKVSSSSGKQFTIGGTDDAAFELLPITEEHEHPESPNRTSV